MQNHRGRSQQPGKHGKPTSYSAKAPNQVWTWDITYLNGPVKGLFFFLYLILDLFSRDIVGWEVWEEESADMPGTGTTVNGSPCAAQRQRLTNERGHDAGDALRAWNHTFQ